MQAGTKTWTYKSLYVLMFMCVCMCVCMYVIVCECHMCLFVCAWLSVCTYVNVVVYTALVYFCAAEAWGSGQCQAVFLIEPRCCEAERGPAASISAMAHFCSSAFSIALCILCLHGANIQPFRRAMCVSNRRYFTQNKVKLTIPRRLQGTLLSAKILISARVFW